MPSEHVSRIVMLVLAIVVIFGLILSAVIAPSAL
jgi:energy-converting hydrogenase Eha subunit F